MTLIRTDFLVYGECACGWSMATHAGGSWPKCPRCGEKVKPPLGRAEVRYGYVAQLFPEGEAYKAAWEGECDVINASPGREGDTSGALQLDAGKVAYHLYSRQEVQAQRKRARRRDLQIAFYWLERRCLSQPCWSDLPPLQRWLPTALFALLVGYLHERYIRIDSAQFVQLAQGTLPRGSRFKRMMRRLVLGLERPVNETL